MSEKDIPKKKTARKTTRKRTSTKKAAKQSEEQLSLPENTPAPAILPGESLSSNPVTPAEAPKPAEESVVAATAIPQESEKPKEEPQSKEESSEQPKKPKSRVRDARKETPEESSEPLIKEVDESNAPAPQEQKDSKDKKDQRDQNNREESRDDRPEKGGRRNRNRGRGRRDDGQVQQRVEVDFDQLRKKAWKIYQSEVTEEGLALLDNNGLREYARSSFNAARLFLEEQAKQK